MRFNWSFGSTADNRHTHTQAVTSSYIEVLDDDDELPPIPDDWAPPIIATHCHPPLQPQSAAVVCASPAAARFHPSSSSARSTDDSTRDFKWLTDIFAVRIHFHHFIKFFATHNLFLVILPHSVSHRLTFFHFSFRADVFHLSIEPPL